MTVIYLEDVRKARAENKTKDVAAVEAVEDWKIEIKTIKKFTPGFLYEGVERVVRRLCRNNNK